MDLDASIANVMLEVRKREMVECKFVIKIMASVHVNVEWLEGKDFFRQCSFEWIYYRKIKHWLYFFCNHYSTKLSLRKCDDVLELYYLPTFHQFKKEIEDGYRQDNEIVRIGYKDEDFPGYSWRGYGVYSQLQDEVLMLDINSIHC